MSPASFWGFAGNQLLDLWVHHFNVFSHDPLFSVFVSVSKFSPFIRTPFILDQDPPYDLLLIIAAKALVPNKVT